MMDPDEIMEDLEAHQDHIQDLIMRSKQQKRDINEAQEELTKLKNELEIKNSISSEDEGSE